MRGLIRFFGGIVSIDLATDLAGAPCPVARTGVVVGNAAVHGWLLRQLRVNG